MHPQLLFIKFYQCDQCVWIYACMSILYMYSHISVGFGLFFNFTVSVEFHTHTHTHTRVYIGLDRLHHPRFKLHVILFMHLQCAVVHPFFWIWDRKKCILSHGSQSKCQCCGIHFLWMVCYLNPCPVYVHVEVCYVVMFSPNFLVIGSNGYNWENYLVFATLLL